MKRNYTNQRGDTIIEVLLAMSVIGMVLGTSFGIANRSVQMGQDAKERTQALKIAESQVEIFKSEFNNKKSIQEFIDTGVAFCMNNSEAVLASETACKDTDGSGSQGLFSISILPPGDVLSDPTRAYEFKVTWTRLGAGSTNSAENQSSLSLYYKPGSL